MVYREQIQPKLLKGREKASSDCLNILMKAGKELSIREIIASAPSRSSWPSLFNHFQLTWILRSDPRFRYTPPNKFSLTVWNRSPDRTLSPSSVKGLEKTSEDMGEDSKPAEGPLGGTAAKKLVLEMVKKAFVRDGELLHLDEIISRSGFADQITRRRLVNILKDADYVESVRFEYFVETPFYGDVLTEIVCHVGYLKAFVEGSGGRVMPEKVLKDLRSCFPGDFSGIDSLFEDTISALGESGSGLEVDPLSGSLRIAGLKEKRKRKS